VLERREARAPAPTRRRVGADRTEPRWPRAIRTLAPGSVDVVIDSAVGRIYFGQLNVFGTTLGSRANRRVPRPRRSGAVAAGDREA